MKGAWSRDGTALSAAAPMPLSESMRHVLLCLAAVATFAAAGLVQVLL